MTIDDSTTGLQIGQVLRDARQRAGLDIAAVESRTKIRSRYLRALENEQWDVLPGHAYAKGFLRTYAQAVGLDGDALVDEYRRRVEAPDVGQYPLAESPIRARRRGEEPGEPRWSPGRGWVIGGLIVALVAVLVVLGVTAGEDEPSDGRRGAKQASQGKEENQQEQAQPQPAGLPLQVEPQDTVQVCLLNGEGDVLLDKTLSAGESKEFDSQRYELRFPVGFDTGQIELLAGGEPLEFDVDPQGPVAYMIEPPGSLKQIELTSQSCP
jgi:cytoskeleton protein RodZ